MIGVLRRWSRQTFLPMYLYIWARLVIRVRRPRIVGITGTVGKTTTMTMISAVLTHPDVRAYYPFVDHTKRGLNDDTGVPITILGLGPIESAWQTLFQVPLRALAIAAKMRRYPDLFVLEFGTGWTGHLHRLATLAPPDIAVVTTIGPAHLDRHKTVERVAVEKSALVLAANPSGLVVLGGGHDYVDFLCKMARAPVRIAVGQGEDLARSITSIVCEHLGIPEDVVVKALCGFVPPSGRLNRLALGSLEVIDDAFNASPLSMKLALDTLAGGSKPGNRKVAVLGFMAELGPDRAVFHEQIGDYARERANLLIGVGDLARHYKPDMFFERSTDCADALESIVRDGDRILVKGSHSVRMDVVVDRLRGLARGA